MTRIRHARVALAAFAALLLGAGARGAPVISGNYYEDSAFATCSDTGICKAVFAAIPSGRKALITEVACDIQASGNNAEIRSAALGVQAGTQFVRPRYLLPNLIYTAAGSTQRTYVVSQPALLLVAVNRPALLTFFSTNASTINLSCQIVGTISSP